MERSKIPFKHRYENWIILVMLSMLPGKCCKYVVLDKICHFLEHPDEVSAAFDHSDDVQEWFIRLPIGDRMQHNLWYVLWDMCKLRLVEKYMDDDGDDAIRICKGFVFRRKGLEDLFMDAEWAFKAYNVIHAERRALCN